MHSHNDHARSRRRPLQPVDPYLYTNNASALVSLQAASAAAAGPVTVVGSISKALQAASAKVFSCKNCGEEFHQQSLLGHGNFAAVHSAVHKGTGEVCVLKTLNRQPKHTQKLQQQFDGYLERERWCLENISHPNVLSQASHAVRRSLGLGNSCTFTNARGSVTLVQEYANKGDLFYHIERNRFLPEIDAMSIFDQLLCAVACLHTNGVVHLDLKCENVFLQQASPAGKLEVKLGDFGLVKVKALGDSIEDVTDHSGTENSMSPESLRRRLGFDGKR